MNAWISVKDRLPEHSQHVKIKGHFPFEGLLCEFEKDFFGHEFVKIRKPTDHGRIIIGGVTHWMPISKT